MEEEKVTSVIVDTDLNTFKKEMELKPVGQCLSMRNFLSLEYERVKVAFNELTQKAIAENKQEDKKYINTLQGMNLIMFNIEQKIVFLNDRIEELQLN